MNNSSEFIDLDNLPERFLPELRNIDFRYDNGSRCFHFHPIPVDCDVILCDVTGVHVLGVTIGQNDEALCPLDKIYVISPGAGVIWLHRGSLNQWRLLAWWGDPQQLRQHDDAPIRSDYPVELKIAF